MICHIIMSNIKQDGPARHFILDQQEKSVLEQRETESLKIKGRAEEFTQVNEEKYGSESLHFVKKEDHIILKQEMDTLTQTDYGSLEIKEEPEELELPQMKEDDCQSESQQMVKIEVEDISQDENQNVLKQEMDAVRGTDSGSLEIKEEPVELELKQVKEEEYGSGPQQMVKLKDEAISQNINQDVLKQETDTLILKVSDYETDHQQPHLSGNANKILFQNVTKADYHQELKTHKGSGSSKHEEQQNRPQKTRGQRENVAKGMTDKKKHKGIKCKRCKVCGKSFKFSRYLKVHMRSHTGEKPFSCTTCGKCFVQKSTLNTHMGIHKGEKPFSCISCGKAFSQKNSLSRHMGIHKGEKPFSCETCGKGFVQKSSLNTHMITHTGDKPFSCITCGKSFNQKSNLNSHMKTHTGEKPLSCITCGKRFSQKSILNSHMRTHTGEKPFSCATCGKNFSQKRNLITHMRRHTGERPFYCVTCGRSFSVSSELVEHTRFHTGEKPLSCLTCGKRFSQRSSLSRHMRTHIGEKPFSCIICKKDFSRKSTLTNHVRSHTK